MNKASKIQSKRHTNTRDTAHTPFRRSLRKRPPRNVAATIRESLAKEFLCLCFQNLESYGLSSADVRRLSREAIEGEETAPISNQLLRDTTRLARLVSEWTENPMYVDESGRPKALSVMGQAPSLESLAGRYFKDRAVSDVLRFATKLKAIERIGRNAVAPLGTCVLLTGDRTLLLSHAVRAIRWFLATNEYNGKIEQSNAWPERLAFAEVPESKFQEFLAFMRDPLINLVDMGNRWLMAQASLPGGEGERKALAGVHAYIFKSSSST
jgi:hypothetical protein